MSAEKFGWTSFSPQRRSDWCVLRCYKLLMNFQIWLELVSNWEAEFYVCSSKRLKKGLLRCFKGCWSTSMNLPARNTSVKMCWILRWTWNGWNGWGAEVFFSACRLSNAGNKFVNDFRFVSVTIFSHLFSIETASFLSLEKSWCEQWKKKPGYLLYIGDEKLPNYMGITINNQ